jgi:hypothetical protein
MAFWKPNLGERQSKFAKEVGIIILGVLIALGLGAIATEIGWRIEVRAARQQLRYELGHNFERLRVWESAKDCTERRLNQLAKILAEASATRRLPPVGAFVGPPVGTWPRGVWESENAAQTAAHFPSRELASISRLYGLFEGVALVNLEARDAWITLSMMAGPGRPLDVGTEAALYAALAKARAVNNVSSRAPRLLMQRHLGAGYAQVDPGNPPLFSPPRICATLGAVPPTYGGTASNPTRP